MAKEYAAKQFAHDWVDQNAKRLSDFNLQIWKYAEPAWVRNVLGGQPFVVDSSIFVAGKAMAGTLLDLITQPEELQKVKDEFDERTGGRVGGSKGVGPLLPKDFKPPIDLRWPEYIQTVRGEEWWIPTPDPDAMFDDEIK